MRATLSLPNPRMKGTGEAFPASIPAPVKGWDAISSLADMPPDHAVMMQNFIPRPGYVELRNGCQVWVTGCGAAINTLMAYNSPTTTKLFAILSNGSIFDVSATGAAVATASMVSNSIYGYVNFTNASDTSYLFVAAGGGTPMIYNGSTWATAGITGVTGTDIVNPAVWKGRLWFVVANSTKVAYMPIGAISGTATTFDLGSFMSKGGKIKAIGTWTIDTKQNVDEYIAFISTKGQVFVYQGTDPSTINTFALVGIYDLGAPVGDRCFLRISGNLWVITQDGVIPLTEMLVSSVDRLAAPRVSISANIMNAINLAIGQYGAQFGWQLFSYPKGTLVILNIGGLGSPFSLGQQYVMNTINGSWCSFSGISTTCWELYNDLAYFGGQDGNVYQWDTGGSDYIGAGASNVPIVGIVQGAWNYFETRGYQKRFTALRPIFTVGDPQDVTVRIGLYTDFATTPFPTSIVTEAPSVTPINWGSIDGIGMAASIVTVATSTATAGVGIFLRLTGWDVTMEKGVGFY